MIFGNLKKLKLNLNKILIIIFTIIIGVTIILAVKNSKDETASLETESTQALIQETTTEEVIIPIDFQSLQATNDDIIAWINIPETNVDYPVLQSDENMEENYYLNTTPEGISGYPGSVFIQKINNKDFSDTAMSLYGHNMANETMFGSLHYFNNRDFFDEFNIINVYTPDRILKYKVIAAFKSGNESFMYKYDDFKTSEKYQEFLDSLFALEESDLNHINRDIEVSTQDRIIILTTCIGDSNYRWRVIGVLVEEKVK